MLTHIYFPIPLNDFNGKKYHSIYEINGSRCLVGDIGETKCCGSLCILPETNYFNQLLIEKIICNSKCNIIVWAGFNRMYNNSETDIKSWCKDFNHIHKGNLVLTHIEINVREHLILLHAFDNEYLNKWRSDVNRRA